MVDLHDSDVTVDVLGLTFGYRSKGDVFSRFGWRVKEGEWWAIVGPSGCGKTTLLHLMSGLRQAQEGQVVVGGQPVDRPRSTTGLILQDFGLLPWASVEENVGLGLSIRGIRSDHRHEVVDRWLEHLGLQGQRHRYPSQLSGGQRQRVAIARTLALDPGLLLMDEPFGSLDSFTREGLQNLLVSLGEERRRTCVLVTHDIEEAVFLGSKILILGHPPIRSAVVADNPLARAPGFREDPEYYRKCSEIKALAVDAQSAANRHARDAQTTKDGSQLAASARGDR